MDIEQTAIERLKMASEMSLRLYKQPLVITYSGGKDSDVLLHLAEAFLFKGTLALFFGHPVQVCLTLLLLGKLFSLGLFPHFKKVRNAAPHNDDTKQTQQNEANQLLRHLHLLQAGIGLS